MSDEKPSNVIAFPNAPGMITLTWQHGGEGVFGFVIEQEAPYAAWQTDQDKRAWSVTGLEPNHAYSYRVCAVYDYNRVCSDEDGVGYVSVTTPPPAQPQGQDPPFDAGAELPKYIASFESVNFPGLLMRHRNFLGVLTPMNNDLDRADASFKTIQGITGGPDLITFESVNFPGYCLRHQDLRLKLQRFEDSVQFRMDATFKIPPGLGIFGQVRYEAPNFPGYFIRHSNFELWLAQDDGSRQFKLDSTWRRLPQPYKNLAPGTISFESTNFPGRFIRHRNSLGEVTTINSDLDRADATFMVRQGLNGSPSAVSFESVNYPGQFLRHQNFRLKLHPNDGSELFRQDASFIYNDGASWEGNLPATFESVNCPDHFMRHANFELWLAKNDGSALFKQDSIWRPMPPRLQR